MNNTLKRALFFLLVVASIGVPYVSVSSGGQQVVINAALGWNTFMGSANIDRGNTIAVDGSGNVYIAGDSEATWGTPVNSFSGSYDVFVAKLNSNGVLQWNTFLGSTGLDYASAIAVDGSGNVYVLGDSFAAWGSPVAAYSGGREPFVAKLNSDGELQWHTFMGSSGFDYSYGVAEDDSGNVYVVGYSPETWGSPVVAYVGSNDAFVAKLNSSGALQWNTFMGAADSDGGNGIAVDGSGNAYVVGTSNSTWGTPINAYVFSQDGFLVKLNSSGVRQWNTFLGSSNYDSCFGIDLDGIGNIYVSGYSYVTWGMPIDPHSGDFDGFAAKFDSSGIRQWNTFMGSAGYDTGRSIAVDTDGNACVVGESAATWGTPVIAHAGGGMDAFVVKLDSTGIRQWNTFLGSGGYDVGSGTVVGGSGHVYVTGYSNATWGSPVNSFSGGSDAFGAKILDSAGEPEIHVRFGGINFADGSTRNLGTRTSSFIMGREFTFTIENQGSEPLNLTGSPEVTLSGPQAAQFYVSLQPISPVTTSGSTTFKLRPVRDSLPGFLPIGWTYPVSITVNIPNDDADENPYNFTLNFTLQKDS